MHTHSHSHNEEVKLTSNSSRLAQLLGEMRREMNGAVVGSMRFYGSEYGLNYGVSIATIRAIARREAELSDHKFAKLLYRQEVRELRLAAVWVAKSEVVDECDELDFWARGIINSEVAEEAAFALLHRCKGIEKWLESDDELLQYSAIMALSQRITLHKGSVADVLDMVQDQLVKAVGVHQHLLPKAVVALLDRALRGDVAVSRVESLLAALPENKGAAFIREELSFVIPIYQ